MKNTYKTIAETTLGIIEKGEYDTGTRRIDVKDRIEKSIDLTFTVSPEEGEKLAASAWQGNHVTEIVVQHASTIEALQVEDTRLKTAVLNFASAKNPGGGFLGGAVAQEESLARSSSLYVALMKDPAMYRFNKSNGTFLYSDYMIYSPDVLFWMKDDGTFLEDPVLADVITSPAPNKGAMLQHNREQEIAGIEATFKIRMEKVFALAQSQQVECLILGAWGCGVFRNDPEDVARWFQEVLEAKYEGVFRKVVFAIYDRSETKKTLQAFGNVFETTHQNLKP